MNLQGRRLRWWKEVLAVVVFDLVYEWTSEKATSAYSLASAHAQQAIHVERTLGIFHERAIQHFVMSQLWLIKLCDLFYTTVHFVLPVVTLVWLFRRFPQRYVRWRNALAWMTALALVGFIVFPLLPPRLLPHSYGFVDTLNVVGGAGSFDAELMKDAGNLYAAMPSLHIGWSLWCVFALVPVVRRRWVKALLILDPIFTLFAIIVTANHYFLDAIAGVVVFAAGVAIAGLPRPAFTVAPMARLYLRVPAVARLHERNAAALGWLEARLAPPVSAVRAWNELGLNWLHSRRARLLSAVAFLRPPFRPRPEPVAAPAAPAEPPGAKASTADVPQEA